MEKSSPEIREYIENVLLPKYAGIGGHTDEHIRQVIERSAIFMEQAGDVNPDMVFLIAAYHDLGRLIDNDTHNFESAKMLRADDFLKQRFSAEEIEIMAQAVEDHRSSLGHEPRSIYGKIVSSADRNTNMDVALARVYDYNKHLHPDATEEEIMEECRYRLRIKYSPDGYASNTMYFDDPNFKDFLVETERITRTIEDFTAAMLEVNRKRGK
jgi:uncharacterized protein